MADSSSDEYEEEDDKVLGPPRPPVGLLLGLVWWLVGEDVHSPLVGGSL